MTSENIREPMHAVELEVGGELMKNTDRYGRKKSDKE